MAQRTFPVKKSELKALLFWATAGVRMMRGGNYQSSIEQTIETLAEEADIALDNVPIFAADLDPKTSKYHLGDRVRFDDPMNPAAGIVVGVITKLQRKCVLVNTTLTDGSVIKDLRVSFWQIKHHSPVLASSKAGGRDGEYSLQH